MSSEDLLASLRAAVERAPDDLSLRLHLARMLEQAGARGEAIQHAAVILQHDPTNTAALALIAGDGVAGSVGVGKDDSATGSDDPLASLDEQLEDLAPPMFVEGGDAPGDVFDAEVSSVRLADVAGMDEVKARLEASVLAPIRNPVLGQLYGKSARGGLLLYGPPGCGKTFIARALAGEMGARFLPVSLADVLDMFVGQSERNLHEIFDTARRSAPCVVFLDEIDALGLKRSQLRNSAARGTVNQLLHEMDGALQPNDGVFVLGATNHPWDVDTALRRPGRFDRMLLVLPPDEAARNAVFKYHLRDRPVANIDLRKLAKQTDGYSGADIAYICENAAEQALLDSARSGEPRMIEMRDLDAAITSIKPSIGPWLATARNVAQFANEGGAYDDLLAYLRKRGLA